jgi:hypothetical protein
VFAKAVRTGKKLALPAVYVVWRAPIQESKYYIFLPLAQSVARADLRGATFTFV